MYVHEFPLVNVIVYDIHIFAIAAHFQVNGETTGKHQRDDGGESSILITAAKPPHRHTSGSASVRRQASGAPSHVPLSKPHVVSCEIGIHRPAVCSKVHGQIGRVARSEQVRGQQLLSEMGFSFSRLSAGMLALGPLYVQTTCIEYSVCNDARIWWLVAVLQCWCWLGVRSPCELHSPGILWGRPVLAWCAVFSAPRYN
jgi:hypothetical protein